MTYMTSGYRAAHGLPPANHDRFPRYIENPNGDYATPCPRPEYDVPDNPILVDLRDDLAHGIPLSFYVRMLADDFYGEPNMGPRNVHARRVVNKLAAVYGVGA
jgi:hypothetical protein